MRKGMRALAFVLGVVAMLALTASVSSAKKPPRPEPPPEEAAYSITDLGVGRAYAINNLGDVAGRITTESGKSHAAILALSSVPNAIDLGTLGGSDSVAVDINDPGQVVGRSTDAYDCTHAFLVSPVAVDGTLVWYLDENPADGINDLMIDLDPLSGVYPYTFSSARAINDQGQVVGFAIGSNDNYPGYIVWERAVLWQLDANGDVLYWVDLPGLDGAESYNAYDINDSGQVVGCAYGSDGLRHAVLWEVDAEGYVSDPVDLGYLAPEHEYRQASGINELGEVVGDSGFPSRAFLVTPDRDAAGNPVCWFRDADGDGINDLMVALSPPDKRSMADAINDSAQVVGWADIGRKPKTGAFLWENGVMTPLIKLIPSEPKWELRSAYGINEAGQIVGGGSTEREYHGYLLTPTN